MHILDILVIFLLIGFAASGVRRGFVFELMVTIGLASGLFLTIMNRDRLQDLAGRFADPGWELTWVSGLVFLVFFLIIYLGFAFIGHKLHSLIERTPFRVTDRALGILAGGVKGAFLIGALVLVMQWADHSGNMRTFLNKSQLIRWGKQAAHSLTHWEPWEKRAWV